MRTYGEFCPMALAAEIVAERWTLLILRELAFGATRFNDIHRGIPRISSALLTQRLRTLEQVGIIARRDGGYILTEAGAALVPAIDSLAIWGKTWLPATLSRVRRDPDVVMWDMQRRMFHERLPDQRTILMFTFPDQPRAKQRRWMICSRGDAQFCTSDPGFEIDLYVTTDSATLLLIWYGDQSLTNAIEAGSFQIDGPRALVSAFPSWIKLSAVAHVPRRTSAS